jgi:CRISPR-associated protein Cas5d
MKVERVSYDVMTPSAARGLLESIYFKPQMRWVIDRIEVLRPIEFISIRRNEVGAKASYFTASRAMTTGRGRVGICIESEREQRAGLVLRDVGYVVSAHIEVLVRRFERGGPELPLRACAGKHLAIFSRRARTGQCWQQPYLGQREYPARCTLLEGTDQAPESTLPVADRNRDFGIMLHDLDFDQDAETKAVRSAPPRFFRARTENGVITVPPFHAALA